MAVACMVWRGIKQVVVACAVLRGGQTSGCRLYGLEKGSNRFTASVGKIIMSSGGHDTSLEGMCVQYTGKEKEVHCSLHQEQTQEGEGCSTQLSQRTLADCVASCMIKPYNTT